jgi:dephospho-CoA kinase
MIYSGRSARPANVRHSRLAAASRLHALTVVLVTGMSGTGKSTVLAELSRRGHQVVDTDHGGWSEEAPAAEGGVEQLWREERIEALLDQHRDGTLFLSGCVANQGAFYPRFAAVVLLSAPLEVLLERIASRRTNDFGKTGAERQRILGDLREVEPMLRRTATAEIDTRRPVSAVADELESIAGAAAATRQAP